MRKRCCGEEKKNVQDDIIYQKLCTHQTLITLLQSYLMRFYFFSEVFGIESCHDNFSISSCYTYMCVFPFRCLSGKCNWSADFYGTFSIVFFHRRLKQFQEFLFEIRFYAAISSRNSVLFTNFFTKFSVRRGKCFVCRTVNLHPFQSVIWWHPFERGTNSHALLPK